MRVVPAATLAALAVAAAGCTSTPKVTVIQPGDRQLSCDQLRAQLAELDQVKQKAKANQGLNATNMAAAVLFAPAFLHNVGDAQRAEQLAAQRRTHLSYLAATKNCPAPAV